MYINHKRAVKMTDLIMKAARFEPHHIDYDRAFDILVEFLENSYEILWNKLNEELEERDVCLSEISVYKLKSVLDFNNVQAVFKLYGINNNMDFKEGFAKLLKNWHKDMVGDWEYERKHI